MKAFIYHELHSTPSASRLEFQVERKLGRGILVYYPIVCLLLAALCGLVVFSQEYPPDWSVGIGIGALLGLAAYPLLVLLGRMNRFTVLTVSSEGLTATGRGVGGTPWGRGIAQMPLAQVEWLGFVGASPGGLGSVPSGLFAAQGTLENTCLLPGIGREEAESVVAAMAQRFPVLKEKSAGTRTGSGAMPLAAQPGLATMQFPSSTPRVAQMGLAEFPSPSAAGFELDPAAAQEKTSTKFMGEALLAFEEGPAELRFRVDYKPGPFQRMAPALFSVVMLVIMFPLYRVSGYVFPGALVAMFALFFYLRWYMRKTVLGGTSTSLVVDAKYFHARGDRLQADWAGNMTRSGEVIRAAEEIKSFGYGSGADGEPAGLWVFCGLFKSQCLLPGLDRQQATAVTVAITRRFPEYLTKAK